jgi:hypothetical protein
LLSTKEEFSLCLKTITCLMLLLTAVPADCKVKTTSGNKPQLEQLSDTRFALEDLEIDIQESWIRFPAEINMDNGPLEVVACTEHGKLHESLLVCDIKPYQLQVALLLLGKEMGNDSLMRNGTKPDTFSGEQVALFFETENEKIPVNQMIHNVPRQRVMDSNRWRFSGSYFESNGRFAAEEVGSLITTYYDLSAILQNPRDNVFDDTFYVVDTLNVLPKGTKGYLLIDCAGEKK